MRSLGSVRERLAYDLMDRCCVSQLESGDMCFAATHANLADAVGTTRESISRALAKLRNEGAVATTPGLIRVADPMRLGAIVRGLVS